MSVKTIDIPLSKLTRGPFQTRVKESDETINDYLQLMIDGQDLGKIKVIKTNDHYTIIDGHHRFEALRRLHSTEPDKILQVELHKFAADSEALILSIKSNSHGKALSRADKRNAAKLVSALQLKDADGKLIPTTELAKLIGVSRDCFYDRPEKPTAPKEKNISASSNKSATDSLSVIKPSDLPNDCHDVVKRQIVAEHGLKSGNSPATLIERVRNLLTQLEKDEAFLDSEEAIGCCAALKNIKHTVDDVIKRIEATERDLLTKD